MSTFPIVATTQALGGASKVAAILGTSKATAYSWLLMDRLPKWRIDPIKRLAEQNGINLDAMAEQEAEARKALKARLVSKRRRRARRAKARAA